MRRELGLSYKKIAAHLSVSPDSVFNWARDIPISEEHRRRNLEHMTAKSEVVMKRAETWSAVNRERRLAYQAEGRSRAQLHDPLHQAGCLLYWAEGSKERNSAVFANSDPAMLRLYKRFLVECFDLTATEMSVRLNVYLGNGRTIDQVEEFWLTTLTLPRSCLRRHVIDHFPTSSSGSRPNRLPNGVCTLQVCRTSVVQHIFGAIQEYAGFDEPRWLDGPPRRSQAAKSPSSSRVSQS